MIRIIMSFLVVASFFVALFPDESQLYYANDGSLRELKFISYSPFIGCYFEVWDVASSSLIFNDDIPNGSFMDETFGIPNLDCFNGILSMSSFTKKLPYETWTPIILYGGETDPD